VNRKNYFYSLFKNKEITIEEMAEKMGIKRDSLYRKIIGKNGFSEKDIKKILEVLEMDFKEVFI
jgi:transcriptional regulator with XRE-family HTH domain